MHGAYLFHSPKRGLSSTFGETTVAYMRSAYNMIPQENAPVAFAIVARPTAVAPGPLTVLSTRRIALVRSAGFAVLRYGLVLLLLAGGASKFAAFEAEGIRPFIEHSPFFSWMYALASVRAASAAIGVVELALAIGIALRRWRPLASGLTSLAASVMFLLTWSFFFTTPGATAPGSDVGGFLMKDLVLLGASLAIAAEALEAARSRAGGLQSSP